MDHVTPASTRNDCDSTRGKLIQVSFAMAFSEIFTKKVTRLMNKVQVQSKCNSSVSKFFKVLFRRIFEITMILVVTSSLLFGCYHEDC